MEQEGRRQIHLTGAQFNEMLASYPKGDFPPEITETNLLVGDVKIRNGQPMIPDRVRFMGSMDASETKLINFQHEVKGHATFAGCKSLIVMGSEARFHGDLNLRGTGMGVFDSVVEGNLTISECADLKAMIHPGRVDGNLDASDCPSLGRFNLAVKGDANFKGCSALRDVGKHGFVHGQVEVAGTPLKAGDFHRLTTSAMPVSSLRSGLNRTPTTSFAEVFRLAGVSLPDRSDRASLGRSEGR